MTKTLRFVDIARNITGGTFVESIQLTDNYGIITFYSNFKEYKIDNPYSLITKKDYIKFFETAEQIEKILVIENISLLRQFPTLVGVKMTLQFDKKIYSMKIDRASVNDYLGFKIEDLKIEDGSWNSEFLNPIGYNDLERKNFIRKFGKVNIKFFN